jgi:hypothetical protein
MLAVPLLASLILSAAAQSGASAGLGGLGFAEALARAERYEDDAKAQAWRAETLTPFLNTRMTPVFTRCEAGMTTPQRFTLVVSFKGGRFDRVEANDDGPVARCMADAFSAFPYPAPPYDDFAEEMRLDLQGGR